MFQFKDEHSVSNFRGNVIVVVVIVVVVVVVVVVVIVVVVVAVIIVDVGGMIVEVRGAIKCRFSPSLESFNFSFSAS